MRIGILTLPFNNNYGGYLQCYALLEVLKSMGHSVTIIDRMHERRPLVVRFRHTAKALVLACMGKKHKRIFMSRKDDIRVKGRLMMPFVDKNLAPRTSPIYNSFELFVFTRGRFDAIIVGSDQVWRPDYGPKIQNYFLDFAGTGVRKISYAASFGQKDPSYSFAEMQSCSSLLEQFDYISVREQSGLDIIHRWHTECRNNPQLVLDPTMLIEKRQYASLVADSPAVCNNKAFCYVLDESETAKSIIDTVCREMSINAYHILDVHSWKRESYVMPSIESWLKGIEESEIVITDSFHGTVFSIIFNKPFVVYANKERGIDRFVTLLETFGLTDRIAETSAAVHHIIRSKIDWNKVNTILIEQRKKSIMYLRKSLS